MLVSHLLFINTIPEYSSCRIAAKSYNSQEVEKRLMRGTGEKVCILKMVVYQMKLVFGLAMYSQLLLKKKNNNNSPMQECVVKCLSGDESKIDETHDENAAAQVKKDSTKKIHYFIAYLVVFTISLLSVFQTH